MSWCGENLRDLAGWDACGLRLTTPSNESAKLLDCVVRMIVSWRDCEELGGMGKILADLQAADPDAALTRALLMSFQAFSGARSMETDETFKQAIEDCEKFTEESTTINDRERKHLKASTLWSRGFFDEAQSTWEDILREYPNDLMAVKFSHESYFFTGNAREKRDGIARVLPHWKSSDPLKSFLHGMYAFGLEECGEFDKAEEHARLALRENGKDAWATHALAHVMEMTGRTKDERTFLEGTVQEWGSSWFANHTYWHSALPYVEEGDFESALTIFDKEIFPRTSALGTASPLATIDAASLLWRLELEGVDVGKRWTEIPDMSSHIHDHCLAASDAHYAYILQRNGKLEQAQELTGSLRNFITSGRPTFNHRVSEQIGMNLCEGMLAYAEGEYAKAVEHLSAIKATYGLTGSNAQNDIWTLTLINACLKTGTRDNALLAKSLLAERSEKKANSGIGERLAKLVNIHTDLDQ